MISYDVEIVTPIKDLNFKEVSYLRCPGLDGSFGVMSKHRDGIFALSIGEIKITQNGKNNYYSTGGGFAEIVNNSVKILAESLERSNEIDESRASESLKRAQKRKTDIDSDMNVARIEASLVRALNRLRVSKR